MDYPGSKVHGGRALLNDRGFYSTAAIVAEVENTEDWPEGRSKYGAKIDQPWAAEPKYAMLQISNCDRSIAFEVDFRTERGRKNTLHKIDTMIGILKNFRRGVVIEHRRYKKRLKEAGIQEREED